MHEIEKEKIKKENSKEDKSMVEDKVTREDETEKSTGGKRWTEQDTSNNQLRLFEE